MQGTIKEFDDEARSGSVLTDDRIEYAIEPSSLDAVIRILRPGQRVIFEAAEAEGRPVARALRLVTFAS